MTIPEHINSLDRLQAAQFYHGQLGWAVHPLMPPDRGDEQERGKKPLLKGWRNHRAEEVTADFLRRHFNGSSHNNLGCVVRPPFVHVDLDSKPDAGASVRDWLAAQPALTTVPRERTGGGAHLTFLCRDLPEAVLKSKKAVTCQIHEQVSAELYFDGLNIVLSPSVHKSGHRYTWEVTGPIPEVSWEQLRHWFGFELPEAAKRGRPKKEAPWWAAFHGDLSTLDLLALFRRAGRLGECLDADNAKWAVRCPWEQDHSKTHTDIGSDTAIFAAEPPGFKCLHAHCAERGLQEVVEWFESQQPGIVDEHCRAQRVWQEGQKDRDGRPRLVLPGTEREDSQFAAEVAEVLAPKEVWFNKSDRVVSVRLTRFSETAQTLGFQSVEPIEARTAIEDHVQTGIVQMDRDSGQPIFLAKTMTRECAAGLLAAPQLRRKLPEIIRILDFPLPLKLPSGDIAAPKLGYDPRFRIYTDPAAPELCRMSRDEALEWMQKAHIGFGFRDRQSLVHAIARFLTPYCRGLMGWDGRFPLWHFSGNRPRAGKDYLAGITQIVYEGRTIEDAPLERESEETRKRITAALMSGRRMLHFANCQGHIQDAAFIGAITSKTFGARNLGSTEAKSDLTLPNEIEFSLSANIGLTFRPDVEPRTRRITLEFPEDNSNGRDFPNPELHDWVRQHRREVLSAIHSLVGLWIEGGCPPGKRPFNSFPEWATVVGGVMGFHNLGDPCEPHVDDGGLPADRQTEAMRALFVIAYAAFPDKWINKAEIYEIIESNAETEAFSWFGDLAEKGVKHRVGKDLRQFKDRELDGIQLRIDDHAAKSQQHRFQFTKHGNEPRNVLGEFFTALGTPQPAPAAPTDGHIGQFGHFVALPNTGENKSSEIYKNGENKKSVRTGGRADMPEVPKMPIGRLVTTAAELPALAAAVREARSVALDLETYGSRKGDGLNPWAGDIRLLSLRVPDEAPVLLDLRAIGYDLGDLKHALEAVEIIAHNARFDLLWLRVKCGLRATRVFCTLTASRLLTAGTQPGNDLDRCLERHLAVAPAPDLSRSDWGSMFLAEDQLAYAARDVTHLHALADKLWGDLEADALDRVARLEFDLIPVVVDMETAGMAVDRDRLQSIEAKGRGQAAEIAAQLRQKFNLPKLNPGSPAQLLEALQSAGFDLANTNEDSLKAASDDDIIPLILAFRSAEKLAQQATSLLESIQADGRIHGRFDPTGTATGRFSSKEPNLQNIGRGDLRTCFIPAPGHKLIVADYSQIELRAAAVIANESKMIAAYQAGVDLHRQTAAEVLGKSIAEVSQDDRRLAKAVNFGLIYGQSAPGLVRYAASSYGVDLELDQADRIRRKFFQTYDRLRQWHGVSRNKADAGAREVRTLLGRRRLIPETASEWERFTALVNTPVQGSSADGMKQALVLLASRLPVSARILSTVHDEVIVEVPEEEAQAVLGLVQSTLVEAMAALFPQVPIEVEAGVCAHWGEK